MDLSRRWKHATPAEIDAIRALAAQRLSWAEIGAATGRTVNGVQQLARKRGVRKNRPAFHWSADQLRTLARMKRERAHIRQIAAAIGCTPVQASNRWKKLRHQARKMKAAAQ